MRDKAVQPVGRLASSSGRTRAAIVTVAVAGVAFASAVGAKSVLAADLNGAWSNLVIGVFLLPLAGAIAYLVEPNLRSDSAEPADDQMKADALRLRFDRRLERALENAEDEHDVAQVVIRATETVPDVETAELLMTAAQGVNVRQVAETGPEGEGPGCPVISPIDCTAIHQDATKIYDSSDAIDACPQLADRINGACSAVCVPVKVLGRSVGVVHHTAPVDKSATPELVGYIESIASKAGNRISLMRATDESGRFTSVDPLTGLLNQPSMEEKIRELSRHMIPFTIAICDIDQFKNYNETHGSDLGDAALRLAADALQATLRPNDVLGRYHSDQFLVIFPSTSAQDASNALERVRESLALRLTMHGVAPFTCSFGVTESGVGNSIEDLFTSTDMAVSMAKGAGRNRVIIHGEQITDPDELLD